MQEQNGNQPFDQYAILEIMGKVRLGGRVREEHVFGVMMVRIDVPEDKEWNSFHTRYYHPNALYGITPTTKDVAFAVAQHNDSPPARAWELRQPPQITAGADAVSEAMDADDDDIDRPW